VVTGLTTWNGARKLNAATSFGTQPSRWRGMSAASGAFPAACAAAQGCRAAGSEEMGTMTIRKLDDHTHERLREQARPHRRSLAAEARAILGRALRIDRSAIILETEAIRRSLAGRYTGASTAEIRAARDNGCQEGPLSLCGADSVGGGKAGGGKPRT
jgi:plasmid stability protein